MKVSRGIFWELRVLSCLECNHCPMATKLNIIKFTLNHDIKFCSKSSTELCLIVRITKIFWPKNIMFDVVRLDEDEDEDEVHSLPAHNAIKQSNVCSV